MPWHPCTNSRDSITADQGYAVNQYELDDQNTTGSEPDGRSPWRVTSHCRTPDGTWVGMVNKTNGRSRNDTGDAILDLDWTNVSFAQVVFFPDDGTPPSAFDLPIGPAYSWDGNARYSRMDIDGKKCAIRFVLPGIYFAPNTKSELVAWRSGVVDLQVRTDGSTVWVVVLTQKSVRYPWLSQAKRFDNCGVIHASISSLYEGDGSDYAHDTTPIRLSGLDTDTWWQQSNSPGDDQDDAGIGNSFRWQPARPIVFAGDIGGFNSIGELPASFNNMADYGVLGHLEACASPAEPGVLHLMWAEGGFNREAGPAISWDGVSGQNGQRINYSRWDAAGKIFDNDIAGIPLGGSSVNTSGDHGADQFSSEWIWTDEYILRNDHGSCAAFIWSWATDYTVTTDGPTVLDPGLFAYFDMSSGEPVALQGFDPALIPTPDEAVLDTVIPVGTVNAAGEPATLRSDDLTTPGRSLFCSSLYTDPTLDNTDVYIIGVNFSATGAPPAQASAFYRIPCDGSGGFSFLDGQRTQQYSIVNLGDQGNVATSDFVSDPGNIWIPATGTGGGYVWHLTRTCERAWEKLVAFPPSSIPDAGIDLAGGWSDFDDAARVVNGSPPSIVTDDSGNDWLAAGGTVPAGQLSGGFPFYAAALRARICRCCVPCIQRVGLHVWQVL